MEKILIKNELLKKKERALAGVAQWTERWPANQTVASSIPSQGPCLSSCTSLTLIPILLILPK